MDLFFHLWWSIGDFAALLRKSAGLGTGVSQCLNPQRSTGALRPFGYDLTLRLASASREGRAAVGQLQPVAEEDEPSATSDSSQPSAVRIP